MICYPPMCQMDLKRKTKEGTQVPKIKNTLLNNQGDTSAPKLNMDVSANKEFDRVSSLLGIGTTRKRKHSAPNLIVSNELLDSIEEDLDMEKESGKAINARWAEQILHSYTEAASETTTLKS